MLSFHVNRATRGKPKNSLGCHNQSHKGGQLKCLFLSVPPSLLVKARMAGHAKHFQIVRLVVHMVSVPVMDAKIFRRRAFRATILCHHLPVQGALRAVLVPAVLFAASVESQGNPRTPAARRLSQPTRSTHPPIYRNPYRLRSRHEIDVFVIAKLVQPAGHRRRGSVHIRCDFPARHVEVAEDKKLAVLSGCPFHCGGSGKYIQWVGGEVLCIHSTVHLPLR